MLATLLNGLFGPEPPAAPRRRYWPWVAGFVVGLALAAWIVRLLLRAAQDIEEEVWVDEFDGRTERPEFDRPGQSRDGRAGGDADG